MKTLVHFKHHAKKHSEERQVFNNIIILSTRLLAYAIEGSYNEVCRMILTYGRYESKKLERVTRQRRLYRAIAALNAHQKDTQSILRDCCSIENIRRVTYGNVAAFNRALRYNYYYQ